MRVFLALPVADEIRVGMVSLTDRLKKTGADVKWVEKRNIHLTLKFLGEISGDMLPGIESALKPLFNAPPLNFATRGWGYFPNADHPRVVWVGVGGDVQRVLHLGREVDSALSPLGFAPEKNRKCHLTLGRFRTDRNLEELKASLEREAAVVKNIEWTSTEALLMESELTRSGPIYRVIDRFLFQG